MINMKSNLDKNQKQQQILLRKTIIIIATIVSLNGLCISANSQENSGNINKNTSATTSQTTKNIFSKDFNETSFLEQILIGTIPILVGMSSMALFTFLLTFLHQYSISRIVNLRKTLQEDTGSLEKKSHPNP